MDRRFSITGATRVHRGGGGPPPARSIELVRPWRALGLERRGFEKASTRSPLFASAVMIICCACVAAAQLPAVQPVQRTDPNSVVAHEQLMAKAKQGTIDLYFIGDSITRRWGATDYPELLANWRENFHGWNAADFAWGADTTQNILWRLQNGELDGVRPKAIVILAGTNDVGGQPGDDAKVDSVVCGIKTIIDTCREKVPEATIIVTAIFPRNDNIDVMPTIDRINEGIAGLADGTRVRFLSVNDRLADESGKLYAGMTMDRLHPSLKGYQVWADGLKPMLTEILGPPAAEDHAPPPTGDPSASR